MSSTQCKSIHEDYVQKIAEYVPAVHLLTWTAFVQVLGNMDSDGGLNCDYFRIGLQWAFLGCSMILSIWYYSHRAQNIQAQGYKGNPRITIYKWRYLISHLIVTMVYLLTIQTQPIACHLKTELQIQPLYIVQVAVILLTTAAIKVIHAMSFQLLTDDQQHDKEEKSNAMTDGEQQLHTEITMSSADHGEVKKDDENDIKLFVHDDAKDEADDDTKDEEEIRHANIRSVKKVKKAAPNSLVNMVQLQGMGPGPAVGPSSAIGSAINGAVIGAINGINGTINSGPTETLPENLMNVKVKCQSLLIHLQQQIASGENARAKLASFGDSGGIGHWLGDHVFRPGNPERLHDALVNMDTYNGELQACINTSNQIIGDLADLGNVEESMTQWKKEMVTLIPLMILKITFPDHDWSKIYDANQFSPAAFIAIMGIGGGLIIAGTDGGGIFGSSEVGTIIGSVLDVIPVIGLIDGISSGNSDMELYNKVAAEAADATNKIRTSIQQPVDNIISEIDSFWENLNKICISSGYVQVGNTSHLGVINALHTIAFRTAKFVGAIKTFNSLMTKLPDQLDNNAAIAAGVLADKPTKDDINEFKLYYYYDKKQMNIAEIAKILNISEEKAQGLQAKELLDQGKTPQEIATTLSIPLMRISQIQSALNLTKG